MKCDHLTCTNDAVVYEIFKDYDDVYKWCQTCHDFMHNEWTVHSLCGKKEENFLSVSKEEYVIISVMKS